MRRKMAELKIAAFAPHPRTAYVTVMDDLVRIDDEVTPVVKYLIEGGIEIAATHT